jgi:hypothetical protein
MTELSFTMQETLDKISAGGGVVERVAGGFWILPGTMKWNGPSPAPWYAGASTIQALVARGRLHYTKRQEGRKGTFPVEAAMT